MSATKEFLKRFVKLDENNNFQSSIAQEILLLLCYQYMFWHVLSHVYAPNAKGLSIDAVFTYCIYKFNFALHIICIYCLQFPSQKITYRVQYEQIIALSNMNTI